MGIPGNCKLRLTSDQRWPVTVTCSVRGHCDLHTTIWKPNQGTFTIKYSICQCVHQDLSARLSHVFTMRRACRGLHPTSLIPGSGVNHTPSRHNTHCLFFLFLWPQLSTSTVWVVCKVQHAQCLNLDKICSSAITDEP